MVAAVKTGNEETARLNKKQALKDFRGTPGGQLRGTERLDAWRAFVENLFQEGIITGKQRETWHLPS